MLDSSPKSLISNETKAMIGEMMLISNHFRVSIIDQVSRQIRLTHIKTDFTFDGNVTGLMVSNFRRKMQMMHQRNEECDLNVEQNSTVTTSQVGSSFTNFTSLLGTRINLVFHSASQYSLRWGSSF